MATKPNITDFRASPFMQALLAPVEVDDDGYHRELRGVASREFHALMLIASAKTAALQAVDHMLVHARFYDQASVSVLERDMLIAKAAAYMAVDRFVRCPARNRQDITYKRQSAKAGGWMTSPEDRAAWKALIDADEASLVAAPMRRKRECRGELDNRGQAA